MMNGAEFRRLLTEIRTLTPTQIGALSRAVARARRGDDDGLTAILTTGHLRCAHCQSQSLMGWGQSGDLPRHRCRDCGRTGTALTGTPLAGLRHRHLWLPAIEALLSGTSTRQMAADLGVHENTMRRWGRRLVSLLARREMLGGVVEVDEMFVRRSLKGHRAERATVGRKARRRGTRPHGRGRHHDQAPVLVACDREGRSVTTTVAGIDYRSLGAALAPVIREDSILVSDHFEAYRAWTSRAGVHHERLNQSRGERVRGAYHIQHVNAMHSRIRSFLRVFRGVSTAHLDHYLQWFRLTERGLSATALLGQALLTNS